MSKYISYDKNSRTITFSGDESCAKYVGEVYKITIELSNSNGDSKIYYQTVLLNPKIDESLTSESEA